MLNLPQSLLNASREWGVSSAPDSPWLEVRGFIRMCDDIKKWWWCLPSRLSTLQHQVAVMYLEPSPGLYQALAIRFRPTLLDLRIYVSVQLVTGRGYGVWPPTHYCKLHTLFTMIYLVLSLHFCHGLVASHAGFFVLH